MEKSKEILKQANITPKLKLGIKTENGVKSLGPQRVKFITDKEVVGTDPLTGKEIPMVAYLVEHKGERKSYRIRKFNKQGEVNYLVIRLAEVGEGEEVILEMKRKGIKNFVDVSPVTEKNEVEVEDDEDIPVINEDENESTNS